MLRSLNFRILGPIALLILVGVGSAAWISREALRTYAELAAEERRAYQILERLERVQAAHETYTDYVTTILAFNEFTTAEDISDRYAQLSYELNREVGLLAPYGASASTREVLAELEGLMADWDGVVRRALALDAGGSIPSTKRIDTISGATADALTRMYQFAQSEAAARAEATRIAYRTRVNAIFVAMLSVFAALGVFFLVFGRRLVRSLHRLAAAMERIRGGDFQAEVEGESRRDEIGQIARGVRAFATTLKELTLTKARVEHLAMHDQLTGLTNRRALCQKLEEALTGDRRASGQMALLHVDLDRFKQVNDLMGHGAGDAILKQAAAAMKQELRSHDLCARVGGDEFVIFLDGIESREGAAAIADRVIEAISRPMEIEDEVVTVGASIGIAFAEDAQFDPPRLISNADIALYIAKGSGRGRWAFFTQTARKRFEDDMNLVRDLRAGLDNGEVIAFYQPQIDGLTGAIAGFEALARWRHPLKGLLPPGAFVDLAFENGLGDRLSDVIIESAISALLVWRDAGLEVPSISINFSAKQLRDGGLVEDLDDAILFAGLKPDDIVVEVLESVLFGDDADPALETIGRLKDRGYRIELDDFGTGHASISNLTRFKVDGVKIDRVFVSEFETDPNRAVIVLTLIDLCRNLGIACLAEGVETMSEIESLMSLGCTKFQGYAISPPMPRHDVIHWMQQRDNERLQASA